MQTEYSGIITPLIKKSVSTKAWQVKKTKPVSCSICPTSTTTGESNFGRCATMCPTMAGVFHIQRGQFSGRQRQHPRKNGRGYAVMKKLLEIGGYLNKGYHVFVDNYFMPVPLVHHLHLLSTYITETVRSNRNLLPQQFMNKSAGEQKMYCRSGLLIAGVFHEKKSCHSSL
jgi:hypothetical protein